MIHQHRAFLGKAVCSAWLSLTLATAPAFAQPEAAAEPKPAEPGGAVGAPPAAPEEKVDAAGEAGAAAPAPPAPEAKAEVAGEAGTAALAPAAPAAPKPAPLAAAESGPKVTFELLSAAAYPVYKTRGISGGSLELDMHGMQWPYLPAEPGDANLRLGFSGSVWADTSYQKVDAGSDADISLKQWIQQSRLVLRFSPTYTFDCGWFIQGQGEAVLNGNQSDTQPFVADADDVYVKVGKWELGDLQFGRFQGWELFHLGMGLDLNTFERRGASTDNNQAAELYGATYMWDRPSGAGNAAFHIYPTKFLRFEVLGQLGSNTGSNIVGVRPVGILDFGFVKLKGALEYQSFFSREVGSPFKEKRLGGAGAVQVVLDPYLEFGGAFAGSRVDAIDRNGDTDLARTTDGRSYGGFATVRVIGELLVGGGLFYTRNTNLQWVERTSRGEERTHLQAYGAIQYRLFERLYIKSVTAYGNASYTLSSPPSYENNAYSERLRLMVLF